MESFCRQFLLLPLAAALLMACPGGGGNNNNDPVCGNGTLEIGETCDDGNTVDGDGCDAACQIAFNAAEHKCELPAGFKNGFGGCCNADTECADGTNCIFGFCTIINCADSNQCNAAAQQQFSVASPFPDGTQFTCADFSGVGLANFCMAGSAQKCDDPDSQACPTGETCSLAFNTETVNANDVDIDGLGGVCTTDFLGSKGPGSFCTGETDYECSAALFFGNCIGNTCISACDFNEGGGAGNPACGAGLECVGPFEDVFQDPQFVIGGGGFCIGANCGSQTPEGLGESVLLDNCAAGFSCDFFGSFAEGGDLLYQCQASDPNGGALFDACQQDRFFGQTCETASLCLQAAADQDPNGADCEETADCCPNGAQGCNLTCAGVDTNPQTGAVIPGNCSPLPADPGFCSGLCATSADCGDGICLDLSIGDLNGVELFLPVCFPADQIFDPATRFCTSEADCAGSPEVEGCVPLALAGLGDRSSGAICIDTVDGATVNAVGDACVFAAFDAAGAVCTADADCAADEVCISNGTESRCAARAANTCASGLCFDENLDFRLADNQLSSTFCSANCTTNADCSPNQICQAVLFNDNNTADNGADDTFVGICITTVPANPADQCAVDTDCDQANGETCDLGSKSCVTLNAVDGSSCLTDSDCGVGAECLGEDAANNINGFCALSGCDPALSGIAAGCGSDASVCVANSIDPNIPGICILGCTVDTDCQAVNGALTCQDGDGDGVNDICLP